MDVRHEYILAVTAGLNRAGLPSPTRQISALLPFVGDLLGQDYPFEPASRAHSVPHSVRTCIAELEQAGLLVPKNGNWLVNDISLVKVTTLQTVLPAVTALAKLLPMRSEERLIRFCLVAERMRRLEQSLGSYRWTELRRAIETDRQLYELLRDPQLRPIYRTVADILARRHSFPGYRSRSDLPR